MDIFARFKNAVKIKPVKTDNEVFQLHYRVTAIFLAVSGALVASKQHFGDPIDCITRDDVPQPIMDTYCWVHSTFTVPNACANLSHALTPHPCIDKSLDLSVGGISGPDVNEKDKVYHAYYQWVYFVLFFQAALFYAPHFFWKMSESHLMESLTKDLKNPLKSIDECQNFQKAIDYISNPMRHSMHKKYMQSMLSWEVFNLLNIIIQMFIVNKFLHGSFSHYGWDLLTRYTNDIEETDADPTDRVFPKMTKCTFRRFGPSGDLNRYDALCILPLNILNEKIYLIMWFWFFILAVITTFWLIYRFLVLARPHLRFRNLKRRARYADRRKLEYIIESTPPGTWLIISMMCDNMAPNSYRHLINKLYEQVAEIKQLEEREIQAQLRKQNRRRYPKYPEAKPEEDEDDDDDDDDGDNYNESTDINIRKHAPSKDIVIDLNVGPKHSNSKK